jgi:hypothetical protein
LRQTRIVGARFVSFVPVLIGAKLKIRIVTFYDFNFDVSFAYVFKLLIKKKKLVKTIQ